MRIFYLHEVFLAPIDYGRLILKKVGIPNKKEIFGLIILVLVFLTSGCLESNINIPTLIIGRIDSVGSYPYGNLTRTDVGTSPVLTQAIDEVLANSSINQEWFKITQEEWDQIDQLFDTLKLPPLHEGDNSWYISFEGILLEIALVTIVS